MMDDKTKQDLEHYLRTAQSLIDCGVDRRGKRIGDVTVDRPQCSEAEYLAHLYSAAEDLGDAIAELTSWLENAMGRKAGVLGRARGEERTPREIRRAIH